MLVNGPQAEFVGRSKQFSSCSNAFSRMDLAKQAFPVR